MQCLQTQRILHNSSTRLCGRLQAAALDAKVYKVHMQAKHVVMDSTCMHKQCYLPHSLPFHLHEIILHASLPATSTPSLLTSAAEFGTMQSWRIDAL
jgi:hypothetical protein